MTEANNITRQHRPLMAGIAVMPSTGGGERGTLSGFARRKSDQRKVLVTCQHVLSTRGWDLEGDEWLYEGGTEEADKIGYLYTETVDGVEKKSWRQILPAPDKEFTPTNPLDAVALLISDNVCEQDIKFQLHDFPNHTSRPIVAGRVDAEVGDRLFTVGAVSGEGWGTVESTVALARLRRGQRVLVHLTLLVNRSDYPSEGGDSGAPYVVEDELGNYRMVGIHLGSLPPTNENETPGKKAYVLKASVIEDELGITFGLPAPTAVATASQEEVRPNEIVTLNGLGSQSNIVGDHVLLYQWDQVMPEPAVGTPNVVITNSTQNTATFTAPAEAANLEFRLIVTDGNGAKAAANVTVNVVNQPPTALAGRDKLITAGHRVTLEGSVSDPDAADRDNVTHAWTQDDDNPAAVSLARVAGRPDQRTFTPTVTGEYTFTLTASDPYGLMHTDEVRVRVSEYAVLPTSVTATAAAGSVDISWTGVSIATGYEVEIGIPPSQGGLNHTFHTSTGTSITIGSLLPQTTYEYRVRMTNADGVGPWSATASVVTLPPSRLTFAPNAAPREATPPPMPTGSQWDLRYYGGKIQVRIKELPDVAPGISRTRVYLEAGAPPDVTGVAKPVGTALNRWATALSSSDSQWRTGGWAVRIRYENLLGSSGYSAAKSVIVPAVPPTTTPTPEPDPTPRKPTVAPTGVTATATANSVTVRWAAVNGATGYDMQLGVIEEGGEIGYKGYSVAGLTHTVTNLRSQTRYYYRVRARNAGGAGPWSDPVGSVVTLGEVPPAPTNDQWDIRHSNGKIQAKLISLSTVTPSISEARVHMGTGQPPNRTTVTKAIGTTLNIWVDVLASGNAGWATGVTWAAHIRFENSVGNSDYSLPGKSVTVPRPTPPPRPPVVTHSWTFDNYEGCGPARKKVEACSNGHARHTRRSAAPEPLVWTYSDAVPEVTRNRTEGRWSYTGKEQTDPVDDVLEREQSRTVSWQVKQDKKSQCGDMEVHWDNRPTTETRWIRESWSSWGDTDTLPRITSRGNWRDTSNTRGSLGDRMRRQVRDVYRQKEQERLSNFGNRQTRWVSAPSGIDSRWAPDPEPKVWGPWGYTGRTRISSYGSWRDTSTTRGSLGIRRRRQVRTISRQKEQTRRSNYGKTEMRWVHHSSSEGYRWVSDPEPEVWGEWADTGQTHYDDADGNLYKQQKRTSNYGRSQTRWVT